jgi:hypothetical protein
MPGPERDPAAPDGGAGEDDGERARRLRRFSTFAQAGGVAFLAVVSLGLLPTIIAASYPALGEKVAVAVWVLAPAVPIGLLVVAAFRLRR